VRAAAALLGIEELLDRRPQALSGGQRQRVAVGRAIVRNPQAFLLDEPLSNLDARLRLELRAELKALHRRLRTTTIYVTHDQEEAMTLGDRVAVMHAGRIQQCGRPLDIYSAPINRFVAGFVGMPPMNFLDGRLTRDGETLLFDEGDNELTLCPEHQQAMRAYAGQPVILGVRPEAIRIGTATGPSGGSATACGDGVLRARLSVLETLGERVEIHARTRRHDQIVCRGELGHGLTEGQALELRLDMQRVHFFAPDPPGRNLSLPQAGRNT
jgi:multiple sugar transport system ATP-binding protein